MLVRPETFRPYYVPQRILYVRAGVIGLPYKEIIPPDAEILSLAET